MCLLQANKLRKQLHDEQSKHIREEFGKYVRLADLCCSPVMQMHLQSGHWNRSGTRPNRRAPVDVFQQLVDREGNPIPNDKDDTELPPPSN